MTDYKQLCAELVELGSSPARSVSELAERMSQVMDLADRARAALAEPEPDPFDVVQRQLDKLAGDEEMVIYRWSDTCWCIDHTNPSNAVKLGENNGEYESTGSSLREAVINLKAILPNHLLD